MSNNSQQVEIPVVAAHADVETPFNPSYERIYVWSGDNGLYARKSNNTYYLISPNPFPTIPPAPMTPEFAYFFQTVADVTGTIAADDGKALFQTASSNNTAGITTVAGSGDIIFGVGTAGVYEIDWSLTAAEAGAMALFINGIIQTPAGTVYGSGAVTQQNTGKCLLAIADADILSLRSDNCAAPLTLTLAGTTDTAQVVASIMFKKLL